MIVVESYSSAPVASLSSQSKASRGKARQARPCTEQRGGSGSGVLPAGKRVARNGNQPFLLLG